MTIDTKRLRDAAEKLATIFDGKLPKILIEAADTIDALRAEVKRLKAAPPVKACRQMVQIGWVRKDRTGDFSAPFFLDQKGEPTSYHAEYEAAYAMLSSFPAAPTQVETHGLADKAPEIVGADPHPLDNEECDKIMKKLEISAKKATREMISVEVETLFVNYWSLKEIRENIDRLIGEYGDTALVEKRSYDYSDDEYLGVFIQREETDEELAARLEEEQRMETIQEEIERRQFERLRAKFGEKK